MEGLASQEMVTASWIVILLYMAVTLYFVIRGALKTKSISDYAVGSVTFSPVAVGLALAAAMTSAAAAGWSIPAAWRRFVWTWAAAASAIFATAA